MANPDIADSSNTFEDQVNEAVKNAKRNDDGKLEFSEDTSHEVVVAARAEIRRRDTQAEYTKLSQQQKALKAENDELLKQLSNNVRVELTEDQENELEDMKFSNPEKWRNMINAYEEEAKSNQSKQIQQTLQEVSAEELKSAEEERRKKVLDEFLLNNQGIVLNDDVIANDIPPRITNKLRNNQVTFEDFLVEATDYLKKGKVIGSSEKTLNQPNLSKAGGTDIPSETAIQYESSRSYETEIY